MKQNYHSDIKTHPDWDQSNVMPLASPIIVQPLTKEKNMIYSMLYIFYLIIKLQ